MKTRQELIRAGKVWQVSPDGEPDTVLFEGNKTRCFRFVRENYGMRSYKTGKIRVGKLIYEP